MTRIVFLGIVFLRIVFRRIVFLRIVFLMQVVRKKRKKSPLKGDIQASGGSQAGWSPESEGLKRRRFVEVWISTEHGVVDVDPVTYSVDAERHDAEI
jgi:hypothetical protein